MSFKAEILADSLSPQGKRLTTFKVTYPRMIHSEMCRHRMHSRNTASSRAIPFKKMIKDIQENPFIPIAFQKAHSGMQGSEYIIDKIGIENLNNQWLKARDETIKSAKSLNKGAYTLEVAKDENGNTMRGFNLVDIPNTSVTKQLCNRLFEPFMWTTELITATEWGNFFNLRCPSIYHAADGKYYKSVKDWNNVDKEIQYVGLSCLHPENKSQAEIHIQAIAELMWDALNENTPKQLQSGEWHIPMGDSIKENRLHGTAWTKLIKPTKEDLTNCKVKIATARCARISYETLGDNPKIDYEADIKLHNRLVESNHWSPFEHCAKAMDDDEYNSFVRGKMNSIWDSDLITDNTYEMSVQMDNSLFGWCKNFRGFIQYRHLIEEQNEFI